MKAAAPRLLAAAFLLVLLAPAAFADHVYSHRYVLGGRLVGSDGWPLPGRIMEFVSTGDDFLDTCREGQQIITDAFGDFEFCYHVHELQPSTRVGARHGNISSMVPVNLPFRKTTLLLREPNETGVAPPDWGASYRIAGRAWQPGPQRLEGVQVFGTAVVGLAVNLTVHGVNASPAVFRTTTDGFGDFDLVVRTDEDPANLSLTLEAQGRAQPVQMDTFFHRTDAPIYVSPAGAASGQPTPTPRTAFDSAPGSATPPVGAGLVLAVALGLVISVALSRRKNA